MTVLGPVPASALGTTLTHEHLFIDLWKEFHREGVLNDQELVVREVAAFTASGGRTIVDCSNGDLGRDPQGLVNVARATGVNIVMSTGHYRRPYLDENWIDRNDDDAVAAELIRDLDVGVGDSGIRAGVIGEIGCERAWVAAVEERSFRAAAKAHLATGITISTHAAGWPVGIKQLDILEAAGVAPERVVVGHCDTVSSPKYHLDVARRGAYVQFDTIRGRHEAEVRAREDWILELIDAGFINNILLSHDVCLREHLAVYGGCGYTYILNEFVPRLSKRGLSEKELTTLLVTNPSRALTGDALR